MVSGYIIHNQKLIIFAIPTILNIRKYLQLRWSQNRKCQTEKYLYLCNIFFNFVSLLSVYGQAAVKYATANNL